MAMALTVALSGVLWTAAPSALASSPTSASGPPAVITSAGDISCASATACWEIGPAVRFATLVQGVGAHRKTVVAPKPAGTGATGNTYLGGLTCVTSTDCWAVGSASRSSKDNGTGRTYIVHFDGRAWRVQPSPRLKPTEFPMLKQVSCRNARDCWAVGLTGETFRAVVLHWNGKTWASAAVPGPARKSAGGSFLDTVSCVAAGCWAVGPGPSPDGTSTTYRIMVLTAGHWREVPSPALAAAIEPSIACASMSDCWVVGAVNDPSGQTFNLVLHWNGHLWAQVAVPSPGGTDPITPRGNVYTPHSMLEAVSCASATNCWAVGEELGAKTGYYIHPQTLHWNGKLWAEVAPPAAVATGDNAARSVSCPRSGPCRVAGDGLDAGSRTHLLLAFWNGRRWVK